jgi:hypothetical protein
MKKKLTTLISSVMLLTMSGQVLAQGYCDPTPCVPCTPCAPVCGQQCGSTCYDAAVVVGIAAAIAAIILLTNNNHHGHNHSHAH